MVRSILDGTINYPELRKLLEDADFSGCSLSDIPDCNSMDRMITRIVMVREYFAQNVLNETIDRNKLIHDILRIEGEIKQLVATLK